MSTTPQEFIMNFNFKLVYTDIVYNVEISSHSNMNDLFGLASTKFEPHINYDKFYIDFVIAGQDKGELASSVSHLNLDEPLWYEFGKKWRQVSFYVRPVSRETDRFVLMDRYNERIVDVDQVPAVRRIVDVDQVPAVRVRNENVVVDQVPEEEVQDPQVPPGLIRPVEDW